MIENNSRTNLELFFQFHIPYSLTCLYETVLSGIFSSGLFSSPIFDILGRGLANATICDIALVEDVLPPKVSNLKEYYFGRRRSKPVHYSVHSLEAIKAIKTFNAQAYGGYLNNLKNPLTGPIRFKL